MRLQSINCKSAKNSWDSNWLPWSVLSDSVEPYRETQCSKNALQMVDASMSVNGIASGQREKRSMIVRQYLKPLLMGSGPTMSM